MDIWIRSLMEHGDTRAMACLGDEYAAGGLDDEARRWYRRAADAGDAVAMSRLAVQCRKLGDQDGAAEWLERAAEAGNPAAAFDWAVHLEQRRGADAAMPWHRRSAELGDDRAGRRLAELNGEAPAEDGPVARDGGLSDPGSVVSSIVVGIVLAEFLKTLTSKLTGDGYAGAKRWLKGLARRGEDGSGPAEDGNVLLIVREPGAKNGASLNIWLDAPHDALSSLDAEKLQRLSRPPRRRRRGGESERRVFWNQEAGRWEAFVDE